MSRRMKSVRKNRNWFAAALVVTVLSVSAMFGEPDSMTVVQASDALPSALILDGLTASQIGNSQIFSGDLEVEEGEVLRSNVVLYDGDAKVEDGGRIEGNLVVYSGDIKIEEEGEVTGDVSAFSGDIEIKGLAGGDVASWSGDVKLDDSARVEGDISVLSGDIKRDKDAFVGGNVVNGPSFNLKVPSIVAPLVEPLSADVEIVVNSESSRPGILERVGSFFLRILVGFGITIIFIPLAALITYSRPDYIAGVEKAIREQTALTFVVGLFTNLIVGLITAFLVITICLAIFSPLPFIVLLILNLIGWTAVSSIVGQRLGTWLSLDVSPTVLVILGALTIAALVVPLFALGSCFRFIAFVAILLIGALGVGGVIVPWLNQRNGRGDPPAIDGPVPEPAPAPIVPTAPVQPDGGSTSDDSLAKGSTDEMGVIVLPPPDDIVTESVQVDEQIEEGVADDGIVVEDDFTRINGVNGVLDARLKVSGVRTFSELATMSPEAIADIFGWPVGQVTDSQIVEQAQVYAGLA
jgi:cytoskeletal protein CcmA (bactofilin family)